MPVNCLWLIAPQVVNVSSIAVTAEEPESAALIDPTGSVDSCTWDVSGSRYSQVAVHAGLVYRVAPTHPGPLIRRWTKLPKIIEVSIGSSRIVALTAKEPKIALAICPTNQLLSASRDIARARRA